MKKMIMVLMMAFTMMAGLFADIILMPKDILNCYSLTCGDEPVQLLIGYRVDTWEEVYKKTGIGKYGWKERGSNYCDVTRKCYAIIKCSLPNGSPNGDLGWACFEYPGDGSETLYLADIED